MRHAQHQVLMPYRQDPHTGDFGVPGFPLLQAASARAHARLG
jgi:hypothetical protein